MLRITVSYSDNDDIDGFVSDTLRHSNHKLIKMDSPKEEKGTHKKIYMYLSNKK